METPHTTSASIVLAAIRAVETRDLERLHELYDPAVTFEWPPGLPYSGTFSGPEVEEMTARFEAVWAPLQPTADERSMSPTVVSAGGGDVVVEYRWRATHALAGSFETPVLARYRVEDGRLAEARMFYWDHVGLRRFLDRAGVGTGERSLPDVPTQ